MIEWLSNNWGTVVAAFAVLIAVVLVVGVMYRDKKHGKSSCGGSCQGCSMNCPNAFKKDKDNTKY